MNASGVLVTRRQALGFRLARHHLSERLDSDGTRSAAVVGLQHTPPGTTVLALAARADVTPEALDGLVFVPRRWTVSARPFTTACATARVRATTSPGAA